jgi:predicted small integral membrane protein
MLDWMVWTMPVAVFFSCIVLMLVGHDGVGARVRRRVERKGFPADRHHPRRPPVHRPAVRLPTCNLAFVGISGGSLNGCISTASRVVWIGLALSLLLLRW